MDRFKTPIATRFGQNTGSLGQSANSFGSLYNSISQAPRFAGSSAISPVGQPSATTPFRATPFSAISSAPNQDSGWSDITAMADRYRMATGGVKDAVPGAAGGQTGTLSQSGRFDEANPLIAQSASRFGVPPSILKAIINRESSGDWNRNGGRFPQIRSGAAGYILPYVGIFANAWTSWGCPGSASQAVGNQQAQVDCLARGLRRFYDKSPSKSWESVASMHFSGQWDPNSTWRDENGMSVQQYVSSFMREAQMFGQVGGPAPGGGAIGGNGAGGAAGGLATVWGGKGSPNLSYGFGAKNSLGLYSYGRNYGMNGSDHTGIDIPMAINSPVYTPVGGTVVCACTGSGGGCSAFNDTIGNGCGRIELQLDNGHRVVFGHSSRSNVQIGQRVNAGQQVGTSGGMNGPHIHLEYRVPDSSMPAGYRLVNPSQYLGGGAIPTSGASGGVSSGGPAAPPLQPWEARYNARMGQAQQPGFTDITGWRRR
jgi:murein DD-endopeptidase MepM/ murein hydrolase activator NlpD